MSLDPVKLYRLLDTHGLGMVPGPAFAQDAAEPRPAPEPPAGKGDTGQPGITPLQPAMENLARIAARRDAASFALLLRLTGLSQKRLADILGLSPNIGRWARGGPAFRPAPRYALIFLFAWLLLGRRERQMLLRVSLILRLSALQAADPEQP